MFCIYMVYKSVLALIVYIYDVKYLVHYIFFIIYKEAYFLKCRVYTYVHFYECCSLLYYCVHVVRDQTAQATTPLFIINFKDFMHLYIHKLHYISYFNNFLFFFFGGATARGGPWPPLQYVSRPLDPLPCLSIRLFPSFSGPWTCHPAISFLVFLLVLLHTAFRTSFLELRCLAFFLCDQAIVLFGI